MNYCIPVYALSEKTYKFIKSFNFSNFKLTEGEYVFINTNDYEDKIFFVKRVTGKYLILEDEEEFYLYLQYSIFQYNPLTRQIILK